MQQDRVILSSDRDREDWKARYEEISKLFRHSTEARLDALRRERVLLTELEELRARLKALETPALPFDEDPQGRLL